MRLIASFNQEKEAYSFQGLLKEKSIESSLEMKTDPHSEEAVYYVWITNEDDLEKTLSFLEEFKKNPTKYDLAFGSKDADFLTIGGSGEEGEPIKGSIKIRISPRFMMMRVRTPITKWIVWICVGLFALNYVQSLMQRKEYPSLSTYVGMTPVLYWTAYDVPKVYELLLEFFKKFPEATPENIQDLPASGKALYEQIESTPMWKGVIDLIRNWPASKETLQTNLFGQIRQGQIWRIWSPALMHRDLLHILFNMLWLWLLGRQVEQKIGKFRYLLMAFIVAGVTNTLQYLMGGPLFLGYSGVICGLGGFIWVRLSKAPWEGYIIHKMTLIFLGVFVLGMLGLQTIAYIIQYFKLGSFEISIANTAHISGILLGMLLANIPFFYRLHK